NQDDSAFLGAREVAMPITTSTLTTIAIFLPVVYIYGVAGQLFRDQAVTVAFSLVASLVVALTLLPMLSCRFYFRMKEDVSFQVPVPFGKVRKKPWRWLVNPLLSLIFQIRLLWFHFRKTIIIAGRRIWRALADRTGSALMPLFHWFDKFLQRLFSVYHKFLLRSLEKRRLFIAIVVCILLLGVVSVFHLNRKLMPRVDEGEFTVKMELPVGSTIEATEREAAKAERWLLKQKEVKAVFSTIGLSQDQSAMLTEEAALNRATLKVRLSREREISTAEMIARMRNEFSPMTMAKMVFDRGEQALQQILGTTTPPIVIKIRGSELTVCRSIADSVLRMISDISGLKDVHSDYIEGQPEYRIEIDRQRAARFGLSAVDVASAIRGYLSGEQATQFVEFDRKIPIIVRPVFKQRDDLEDLLNLTIRREKRQIPVRDLIKLTTATGPSEIRHEDQTRQISVLADLQGRGLNSAIGEIRDRLKRVHASQNYQILIGGEQEEVYRSFHSLIFAMALAVLLIYMILAAQFESLRHPFIILLDVPLTVSLVLILLWVSGIGLNVISFIGLIVLAGIAVNDSIVKVDFINQRRREGMPMHEAISDASKKRFRPIVMTSVTTILGLLPMAIGFGEGAELQRPLALTVIVGLTISTVVSLVAVPVFYSLLERKNHWKAMAGE
ncbi:MAG: efflux RND transporter permease subunit, partial [Calditrichaeota bacterium]|nr:efflux RND transporter permease subunit [Calditrichota bacterium]